MKNEDLADAITVIAFIVVASLILIIARYLIK